MLCAMQVWIHPPYIIIDTFTRGMEKNRPSVSHVTKFGFYSRTDRVLTTTRIQSINQDTISDDARRSRDLFRYRWSGWDLSQGSMEEQMKNDPEPENKTRTRDQETTGILDTLSQQYGIGRNRRWCWSWCPSTTYLSKIINGFYSIVCSNTWNAYTGIAARGYVPRLVNHGERQYSDGKGNHINGLVGF